MYPTYLRIFHIGYIISLLYGFIITLMLTPRENYFSDASLISSIVAGVILSETGLFLCFFWSYFAAEWTPGYNTTSLYYPDPSYLVLCMTILLSSLSLLVSSGSLNALNLDCRASYVFTFTVVTTFLVLVGTEYLGLSIYINDNMFGTGMFILTGIHCSHVMLGAVLILFIPSRYMNTVTYQPIGNITTGSKQCVLVKCLSEPFAILYLHFVETLWISIHLTFYL